MTAYSGYDRVRPNVQGNRRAAPMVTEDRSMCRRVRLTVGLGRTEMAGAWFVGSDNTVNQLIDRVE